MVEELVAEVDAFLLQRGAGDGGEEDDGLALLLVRDADDGDLAFRFAVEAEHLVDGGLDGFVGNHFAGDLGETRDAPLDVEEAVGIEVTDIAGAEPAVLGKDFLAAFLVAEIAGENVGSLE